MTTSGRHRPVGKIFRYCLAAIGPVGTAATHFLLSLVMLRLMKPTEFGSFTFLLVASQLSWGIWSALFCAPLPVLFHRFPTEQRERAVAPLFAGNVLGVVASFPIFLVVALVLNQRWSAAVIFASFVALSLLRWFGRAVGYAYGRPLRTMASDVIYSLSLLITLGCGLWAFHWAPQVTAYAALMVGAVFGLLPFGIDYVRRHLEALSYASLSGYARILRDHARWALLGVLTTEATANAHVYLVTLMKGPTAFAPIAASSLLMRPVNVAQNALSDFERPQFASLIAGGHIREIRYSLRIFRIALCSIWLGTVALASLLFFTSPRLLFPATYDLNFIVAGSALWSAVAALRLVQTPESTLMQAAGEFQPLALASLWSAMGTFAAVAVLIPLTNNLFSISGLLIGAAIYLYWTRRYAADWMWRQEARYTPIASEL